MIQRSKACIWVDRSLLALAVATALALLWASYCAFTHGLFGRMVDYVIYSNMMWNTAHGRPFEYFDGSYLRIHLSFLLVPLSFVYRLWDHPFVLSLLQWALIVSGMGLTYALTRRARLPAPWAGGLAVAVVLHHFTQQVQLSEFHGVACYYLLFPLLVWGARESRGWTWVPLLALLALREDAGLVAAPVLAWFAASRRWRGGWWLSGLAVGYVFLATMFLYPWINGCSLWDHRTEAIGLQALSRTADKQPFLGRALSLLLILMPLAPFLRKHWRIAACFLGAPTLVTLCSGFSWQYRLWIHYPALFAVLTPLLLVEIASRSTLSRWWSLWMPMLALVSHLLFGYLPYGGRADGAYCLPDERGPQAVWLIKAHVPADAPLLVSRGLKSFAGNRAQLRMIGSGRLSTAFDYAILTRSQWSEIAPDVQQWASVAHTDYAVLLRRRSEGPAMNHSAEALATRIVWMADTPRHYGKNRWDGGWNGGARVRYWRGAGHRFPAVVSYGGHQELPAGRYRIRLHYRGGTPRKHADRSWGWFRLYPLNRDEPCLGSIDIPRGRVDQPGSLTMLFTNEVRRAIEFRIAGGGADLWLHRVEIEPDRSGGAPECPVDSPGT